MLDEMQTPDTILMFLVNDMQTQSVYLCDDLLLRFVEGQDKVCQLFGRNKEPILVGIARPVEGHVGNFAVNREIYAIGQSCAVKKKKDAAR